MINFSRFIAYALIAITLTACGSAQPAEAATKAQSISFLLSQVRASGVALSGGKVDFYEAGGTTTRKTVWIDRNKATPAANPYTLDSNGTAQLYGDGLYRIVIKDSAGVTKYDRDNISIKDVSNLAYDVADYASLAAAVASIGSTSATLQYSTDQTLAANLIIPATLELMPLNGAKIIHSTYTVTVNSSTALWPRHQIFNGTGAVTINNASAIYTAWFGVKADSLTASATANTTGMTASLACANRSAVKKVTPDYGTTYFNAGIVYPGDRLTIEGESTVHSYEDRGTAPVTFMWTGSAVTKGIDLGSYPTQNYNTIRNIRIHGNGLVDIGVYGAGQHIIEQMQVTKTLVCAYQLGNLTNQTFVDKVVAYDVTGDGFQTLGPSTTVFSLKRSTFELCSGNGMHLQSFAGADISDIVAESCGVSGLKMYAPAGTIWLQGAKFSNIHLEANNGTYQLDIDADASILYGLRYLKFNNVFITAPVGAGNGKKYMHIGNVYQPEFQGGYFDGGDTTLTHSQKLVVDTADSQPWFNNVGGQGSGTAANTRSLTLGETLRVNGTGIGAGPLSGVWTGELFSFDTGSIAASGTKSFTVPDDASGLVIVTEAAGAAAAHRRAVAIFDKNNGNLDATELTDLSNILSVSSPNLVITNPAASASSFTVTFIGRSVHTITMP